MSTGGYSEVFTNEATIKETLLDIVSLVEFISGVSTNDMLLGVSSMNDELLKVVSVEFMNGASINDALLDVGTRDGALLAGAELGF